MNGVAPGRPTVLIVDDEPTNIQALYAPLKETFQGRFATSGEQGLALARDLRPDIILLDINLPGLDGFGVLEALRTEGEAPAPMVVFVSGDDDGDLIERAMAAGADDFLVKPCPPSLLQRRVGLLHELATLRAATVAPAGQPVAPAPPPPGDGRVLVVEDGEINRVILWEMLRAMGQAVTMAVSGEEALARLESDRFDAVLLDIHLPGIDGIEVARRLRAGGGTPGDSAQPWLVAVTGDAAPGSIAAYRAAGFDAVVRKPVDPDRLAAALRGDPEQPPEAPIEDPEVALLIDGDRIGILQRTYAGPRLAALFALLERETAGYMATIRGAATAADDRALREASHRLKSALGHFACARAARLADHLAHGEGRPPEQTRHDVDVLDRTVTETLRALRGALDLVDR